MQPITGEERARAALTQGLEDVGIELGGAMAAFQVGEMGHVAEPDHIEENMEVSPIAR